MVGALKAVACGRPSPPTSDVGPLTESSDFCYSVVSGSKADLTQTSRFGSD